MRVCVRARACVSECAPVRISPWSALRVDLECACTAKRLAERARPSEGEQQGVCAVDMVCMSPGTRQKNRNLHEVDVKYHAATQQEAKMLKRNEELDEVCVRVQRSLRRLRKGRNRQFNYMRKTVRFWFRSLLSQRDMRGICVCVCVCMCVCTCVCTCVCICICKCICMCMHMHVYVYMYVYMFMHMHVYVYMYMYMLYMYMHMYREGVCLCVMCVTRR